jgi:hypothetical protein
VAIVGQARERERPAHGRLHAALRRPAGDLELAHRGRAGRVERAGDDRDAEVGVVVEPALERLARGVSPHAHEWREEVVEANASVVRDVDAELLHLAYRAHRGAVELRVQRGLIELAAIEFVERSPQALQRQLVADLGIRADDRGRDRLRHRVLL